MTAGRDLAGIRLVVSDIDGTLVRSDKSLSARTVDAVRRAAAAGIGFTLISARPPSGLGGLIDELRIETPCAAFNGATIFLPNGPILAAHRMAEETARGIIDVYDRLGIPAWVFADGRWMTRTLAMPHVQQETIAARQEPVLCESFERWLARADKVQGICDEDALLARAEAELQKRFGAAATIARSQTYYLDATAPHTDKGHGARELAKSFGVALEAVAVIGDMSNDLPMFRVAGLAVAMGQASEKVKAEAHRVTRSNDDDGVAAFLDEVAAAL